MLSSFTGWTNLKIYIEKGTRKRNPAILFFIFFIFVNKKNALPLGMRGVLNYSLQIMLRWTHIKLNDIKKLILRKKILMGWMLP